MFSLTADMAKGGMSSPMLGTLKMRTSSPQVNTYRTKLMREEAHADESHVFVPWELGHFGGVLTYHLIVRDSKVLSCEVME